MAALTTATTTGTSDGGAGGGGQEGGGVVTSAAASPPKSRWHWGGVSGEKTWSSDTVWGCMLRTGQSLLANALIHAHLGRGEFFFFWCPLLLFP